MYDLALRLSEAPDFLRLESFAPLSFSVPRSFHTQIKRNRKHEEKKKG